MTILAIETATANKDHPASIALHHQGQQTLRVMPEPNSQAAKLVSTIEALLTQHHLWYGDLTQLAITVGPGSFTGIRIGLAVARSIAFACPTMKLIPVTTLEALVAGCAGEEGELLAVMKAGKGDVYSQIFTRRHIETMPKHVRHDLWHARSDIRLSRPEELPPTPPKIGNGIAGLSQEIDAGMVLAALDKVQFKQHEATPLYIRPPDAKPQNALNRHI